MRSTAVLVALMFTVTSVAWASPTFVDTAAVAEKNLLSPEALSGLAVPAEIGHVEFRSSYSDASPSGIMAGGERTAVKQPSSERFVVLIQDAHAIVDAQQNIQKLIEHFDKKYGVRLVALEGAKSKLDPMLFRTFPDNNLKKQILSGYLKRGEITGAQMAAIFDEQERVFSGIEDWGLYEGNYRAYLRAQDAKGAMETAWKAFKIRLDEIRKTVYSEKLNEFQDQCEAFRAERTNFSEFLMYLVNFKKTLAGDPGLSELNRLVNSVGYAASGDQEKLVPMIKAMAAEFKSKYARGLGVQDEVNFYNSYQAYLTGKLEAGKFLQRMIELGNARGFRPKLTPEMQRLLGHTETLSSIKGGRLFTELQKGLDTIERSLISKPEEETLAGKYRRLYLLRELFSLELTHEALAQYLKDPAAYRDLLEDPAFREGLAPAEEFYKLALKRDQAFYMNLTALMEGEKQTAAVVVAGGFHTNGLRRILEERKIAYAVVSPRMASLEGVENYAKVMREEVSYKEYLKTTYYDAFVRAATQRLVGEMNQQDFVRGLKEWRDAVIRDLSRQGRIAEAGDYTRYLDVLSRVYVSKFGKGPVRSHEELLKVIEKELNDYRDKGLDRLWQRFESQLGQFIDGLKGLVQRNELDPRNVSALQEGLGGAKPSALIPPAAAAALDPSAPIISRSETRWAETHKWEKIVSRRDKKPYNRSKQKREDAVVIGKALEEIAATKEEQQRTEMPSVTARRQPQAQDTPKVEKPVEGRRNVSKEFRHSATRENQLRSLALALVRGALIGVAGLLLYVVIGVFGMQKKNAETLDRLAPPISTEVIQAAIPPTDHFGYRPGRAGLPVFLDLFVVNPAGGEGDALELLRSNPQLAHRVSFMDRFVDENFPGEAEALDPYIASFKGDTLTRKALWLLQMRMPEIFKSLKSENVRIVPSSSGDMEGFTAKFLAGPFWFITGKAGAKIFYDNESIQSPSELLLLLVHEAGHMELQFDNLLESFVWAHFQLVNVGRKVPLEEFGIRSRIEPSAMKDILGIVSKTGSFYPKEDLEDLYKYEALNKAGIGLTAVGVDAAVIFVLLYLKSKVTGKKTERKAGKSRAVTTARSEMRDLETLVYGGGDHEEVLHAALFVSARDYSPEVRHYLDSIAKTDPVAFKTAHLPSSSDASPENLQIFLDGYPRILELEKELQTRLNGIGAAKAFNYYKQGLEMIYRHVPAVYFERFVAYEGHGLTHVLKVMNLAIQILEEDKALRRQTDLKALMTAIVFHDIADLISREKHSITSRYMAEGILSAEGVNSAFIEKTVRIANAHHQREVMETGDKHIYRNLTEARIMSDADTLSNALDLERVYAMNAVKPKNMIFNPSLTLKERMDDLGRRKDPVSGKLLVIPTSEKDAMAYLCECAFLKRQGFLYFNKIAKNMAESRFFTAVQEIKDLLNDPANGLPTKGFTPQEIMQAENVLEEVFRDYLDESRAAREKINKKQSSKSSVANDYPHGYSRPGPYKRSKVKAEATKQIGEGIEEFERLRTQGAVPGAALSPLGSAVSGLVDQKTQGKADSDKLSETGKGTDKTSKNKNFVFRVLAAWGAFLAANFSWIAVRNSFWVKAHLYVKTQEALGNTTNLDYPKWLDWAIFHGDIFTNLLPFIATTLAIGGVMLLSREKKQGALSGSVQPLQPKESRSAFFGKRIGSNPAVWFFITAFAIYLNGLLYEAIKQHAISVSDFIKWFVVGKTNDFLAVPLVVTGYLSIIGSFSGKLLRYIKQSAIGPVISVFSAYVFTVFELNKRTPAVVLATNDWTDVAAYAAAAVIVILGMKEFIAPQSMLSAPWRMMAMGMTVAGMVLMAGGFYAGLFPALVGVALWVAQVRTERSIPSMTGEKSAPAFSWAFLHEAKNKALRLGLTTLQTFAVFGIFFGSWSSQFFHRAANFKTLSLIILGTTAVGISWLTQWLDRREGGENKGGVHRLGFSGTYFTWIGIVSTLLGGFLAIRYLLAPTSSTLSIPSLLATAFASVLLTSLGVLAKSLSFSWTATLAFFAGGAGIFGLLHQFCKFLLLKWTGILQNAPIPLSEAYDPSFLEKLQPIFGVLHLNGEFMTVALVPFFMALTAAAVIAVALKIQNRNPRETPVSETEKKTAGATSNRSEAREARPFDNAIEFKLTPGSMEKRGAAQTVYPLAASASQAQKAIRLDISDFTGTGVADYDLYWKELDRFAQYLAEALSSGPLASAIDLEVREESERREDLQFVLRESLLDSWVRGNDLRSNLPIFIELSGGEKGPYASVYNPVAPDAGEYLKTDEYKKKAKNAGIEGGAEIHGRGRLASTMKRNPWWTYELAPAEDIGGRQYAEARISPKAKWGRSEMREGAAGKSLTGFSEEQQGIIRSAAEKLAGHFLSSGSETERQKFAGELMDRAMPLTVRRLLLSKSVLVIFFSLSTLYFLFGVAAGYVPQLPHAAAHPVVALYLSGLLGVLHKLAFGFAGAYPLVKLILRFLAAGHVLFLFGETLLSPRLPRTEFVETTFHEMVHLLNRLGKIKYDLPFASAIGALAMQSSRDPREVLSGAIPFSNEAYARFNKGMSITDANPEAQKRWAVLLEEAGYSKRKSSRDFRSVFNSSLFYLLGIPVARTEIGETYLLGGMLAGVAYKLAFTKWNGLDDAWEYLTRLAQGEDPLKVEEELTRRAGHAVSSATSEVSETPTEKAGRSEMREARPFEEAIDYKMTAGFSKRSSDDVSSEIKEAFKARKAIRFDLSDFTGTGVKDYEGYYADMGFFAKYAAEALVSEMFKNKMQLMEPIEKAHRQGYLRSCLLDVLFNAWAHGNVLRSDLPIFIKINDSGKGPYVSIYNQVVPDAEQYRKTEAYKEKFNNSQKAGIHGKKIAEKAMMWVPWWINERLEHADAKGKYTEARISPKEEPGRSEIRFQVPKDVIPEDAIITSRADLGTVVDVKKMKLTDEQRKPMATALLELEMERLKVDDRTAAFEREMGTVLWNDRLESSLGNLYVLVNSAGEIKGAVFGYYGRESGNLSLIVTRVPGSGALLMDVFLSQAYRRGASQIEWESVPAAKKFYESYIGSRARHDGSDGFLIRIPAGEDVLKYGIELTADPLDPQFESLRFPDEKGQEKTSERSEMRASTVASEAGRSEVRFEIPDAAIPENAVVGEHPVLGRVVDAKELKLDKEQQALLAADLNVFTEKIMGQRPQGGWESWFAASADTSRPNVYFLVHDRQITGAVAGDNYPSDQVTTVTMEPLMSREDSYRGKGQFLLDCFLSRMFREKKYLEVRWISTQSAIRFYDDYLASRTDFLEKIPGTLPSVYWVIPSPNADLLDPTKNGVLRESWGLRSDQADSQATSKGRSELRIGGLVMETDPAEVAQTATTAEGIEKVRSELQEQGRAELERIKGEYDRDKEFLIGEIGKKDDISGFITALEGEELLKKSFEGYSAVHGL